MKYASMPFHVMQGQVLQSIEGLLGKHQGRDPTSYVHVALATQHSYLL